MKPLAIVLLMALTAACSQAGLVVPVQGKSGTSHFVVLGFGVVSVPAAARKGAPAIEAVRYRGVGILASDRPGPRFAIGYVSASSVRIPATACDVRVEVRQGMGSSIDVRAKSARVSGCKEGAENDK